MITVGFSLAGLIVSLAVLAPTLLLAIAPARDQPTSVPANGWVVTTCEIPIPLAVAASVLAIGHLTIAQRIALNLDRDESATQPEISL